MLLLFDFFRYGHIVAGFTALVLLWIPLFTRKGGKVHRKAGWAYVYAMGFVSLSAFYMGFYRIVVDPTVSADDYAFSWFLVFIAILSAATAWYGVRVLRFKQRKERHRELVDLFIPLLLFLSGIGVCLYGFLIDFPLLAWFPLIGIFLGVSQLLYWLRAPQEKMHWWMEHIVGMLSCCIATITAFTVFGAPRLLNVESVHLLLWFLPSIIFVPVIIGYGVYYNIKFKRRGTHAQHK